MLLSTIAILCGASLTKKNKKNNSKIAWSVYINQWNENYLKCMFGFSVLHDAASHKNENASVEMGY